MTNVIENTLTIEEAEAEIQRLTRLFEQERDRANRAQNIAYNRGRKIEQLLWSTTFRWRKEGEFKVKVSVHPKRADDFGSKKTRVFTDGALLQDIADEARPFFVPQGEQSKEYKLATRKYRKLEKEAIMFAFKQLGIDVERINFSQKAGCSSCPCSPGWVVTGKESGEIRYSGIDIADIFVTVMPS